MMGTAALSINAREHVLNVVAWAPSEYHPTGAKRAATRATLVETVGSASRRQALAQRWAHPRRVDTAERWLAKRLASQG